MSDALDSRGLPSAGWGGLLSRAAVIRGSDGVVATYEELIDDEH